MSEQAPFQPLTTQPQEIEAKSFSIITEELGEHPFAESEFPVVQRVIHASADFDLGRSLVFQGDAVAAGVTAIRAGRAVVADVQMVQSGISKPRLAQFGCEVHVHISDPDVAAEAKRRNTTRAIVSVQKAAAEHPGAIYAIGNAPTALLELIRLVRCGEAHPSLIVGVPVGFVSAAESKEELLSLDVPFITNRGRKGGSAVAVAIVNALSLMAAEKDR
ncbi:MAG: precorrin-8X methylmutase [Alicyclobacillaceae bacterium]|nr:precorrin-8X methylmutase [Alicyclobacillaceae bacterium]MCY0897255.1 precorrin-8X methylmutase [Alicyclobacillaceae bacterium]